jgi:hypothetical protein
MVFDACRWRGFWRGTVRDAQAAINHVVHRVVPSCAMCSSRRLEKTDVNIPCLSPTHVERLHFAIGPPKPTASHPVRSNNYRTATLGGRHAQGVHVQAPAHRLIAATQAAAICNSATGAACGTTCNGEPLAHTACFSRVKTGQQPSIGALLHMIHPGPAPSR